MIVLDDGATPALARDATNALAAEFEAMGDAIRSSELNDTAGVRVTETPALNNVLVPPLRFEIGVGSGIRISSIVHAACADHAEASGRALGANTSSSGSLVESATAGAVFYSAVTTTLSFGTLALSGHEGRRTLGERLTIGIFWTVVANLVFLLVLLAVTGVSAPEQQD